MKKPTTKEAQDRMKGIEWERELVLREINRRACQYLSLTGESCGLLTQLYAAIYQGEHHADHPEVVRYDSYRRQVALEVLKELLRDEDRSVWATGEDAVKIADNLIKALEEKKA